jgi:diamine N-acetyltransferase
MLSIRNASIEDIPLIREMCFNVWPQTYAHLLSQDQIDYMLHMMYSEASLKKQMEEEGCCFLVVQKDTEPVAFASYSEHKPFVWKLHKIYILPSQQGTGIGRYIIDHIVNDIRPKNAKAIQLQVNRENKAKDFYHKLGFRIIETADFDIGNGYFMNDYIMELTV